MFNSDNGRIERDFEMNNMGEEVSKELMENMRDNVYYVRGILPLFLDRDINLANGLTELGLTYLPADFNDIQHLNLAMFPIPTRQQMI